MPSCAEYWFKPWTWSGLFNCFVTVLRHFWRKLIQVFEILYHVSFLLPSHFTIISVYKNLHKCLSIWPWKLIHCLLWCRRIYSQEFYCSKFSESSNLIWKLGTMGRGVWILFFWFKELLTSSVSRRWNLKLQETLHHNPWSNSS
jgi:hypothetical protein